LFSAKTAILSVFNRQKGEETDTPVADKGLAPVLLYLTVQAGRKTHKQISDKNKHLKTHKQKKIRR